MYKTSRIFQEITIVGLNMTQTINESRHEIADGEETNEEGHNEEIGKAARPGSGQGC